MKAVWTLLAASAALVMAGAAQAQPSGPDPDYAKADNWLCTVGKQELCTQGLDAMAVPADGPRAPETFQPAADPKIDCFYVYPTVSMEASDFATLTARPEVVETLKGQAARLTSQCRLFAPLYRQLTMTGLKKRLSGGAEISWDGPYRDVRAAWLWYMEHENHGRGVVLIGHSQGALVLHQLIAREIDGKPAQKRLVSAFLAGDPELRTAKGARVGGAFKSIPLCAGASETGCVYGWSTFLADDDARPRFFGRDGRGGLEAGCVNPAAPGGGSGDLDGYLRRPAMAPASDPPWIRLEHQISAECVRDANGANLVVTIKPSRYADLLKAGLPKYEMAPGWGLHRLDLSLPQHNIIDLVAAESRAWAER